MSTSINASTAAAASGAPQCSICLEPVTTRSQRSSARLFCGHFFHLDCIGSEFNFKRCMRCPSCRLVEEGNWRFAAGGFQQAITNDDYQEVGNDNDIAENIVDDFLRVATLGMQPTTISIVRYNMGNGFQYARPLFRTLQPQPQPMPPSVQPAPAPRVRTQQAVWGSAPRTAATTSATMPQSSLRRSRAVGPSRASPARNQGPAPRGQAVRPSSQAHQPRLLRNRAPAAAPPTGIGPVNHQRRGQASSNRAAAAAAVRGSPSRVINHRDVGTSMQPQPISTPSSSSQGSTGAGQLPRRQNSMGYYMSMLMATSDDDEDDLPVYRFI